VSLLLLFNQPANRSGVAAAGVWAQGIAPSSSGEEPSGGVTGTLNASEVGSDTAAFAGQVLVQGTFNASETGSDTAALSGRVIVQGSLSTSEVGSDTFAASGSVASGPVTGTLNASEQGSDTAEILGPNLAPPSTGGGFVMTGRPSKLWWTRKPKALDDEEADRKVKRVVRVIERIAREQADRNVTQPNKVARAEVREQIEPLVQEMPGFDWGTVYRALLIQAAQQRQAILAEQARINAEDDEILLLLMG